MLLHQVFSFNSPVWFNVGTASKAQVSACFILSVDDSMESILDWYKEEGLIFQGGSGAGVNLSRIRASSELLSSGGEASGPVSFMRGADASAGTIKSGGATRRAAKMVILDVDHPDLEEFIGLKAARSQDSHATRPARYGLGGKDGVRAVPERQQLGPGLWRIHGGRRALPLLRSRWPPRRPGHQDGRR
jgi:ribonucleoside-diphosphate reductase alpha chain